MSWLNKKVVSLASVDLSYAFLSYGIDTILVLYLIKILKLSDFEALSSLSVKSCLVYSLPVLTAFISNHWIAKELVTGLGLIIMSSGLILLSLSDQSHITLSLSCLTVGYVLGRPIISITLGKIVPEQKNTYVIRIFHALSNVAYFLAPLIFSLSLYGEKKLFLGLGGAGLCISFLFFWVFYHKDLIKSWQHFGMGILTISGIILAVNLFLNAPNYLKYVFFMALAIAVFYGFQLFRTKNTENLFHLKQFFLLIIFATLFFVFFSQQFFFMPLFIEKYVVLYIGTFKVPTPWFSMVNPLVGVILSPFLIYLTKDIKSPTFIVPFVFGLTGLSFLILFVGVLVPTLLVSMIILAYCALAIAEIIFIPLILSMISMWHIEKEKSILMGFLYLSMACSKIFAPKIALWIHFPSQLSNSITNNPYILPFFIIGLSLCVISVGAKLLLNKSNRNKKLL